MTNVKGLFGTFIILFAVLTFPQRLLAENLTPKIISVSPSEMQRGAEVEIVGENFGPVRGNGYVVMEYSGVSAGKPFLHYIYEDQVSGWSDSIIRVKITNGQYGINSLRVKAHTEEVGAPDCHNALCSNIFQITIKKPKCRNERDWTCSEFTECQSNGMQTRTCVEAYECEDVDNIKPPTSRECQYVPPCITDTWNCGEWGQCSTLGSQTRSCTKTFDCATATTPSPLTAQSCIPPQPACTVDIWSCGDWAQCSSLGNQSRSCIKTFDCQTVENSSPATTQVCIPPQPACNADTWTCGGWDACSLSGIQSRSCTKTFDCASVETAPPSTDQYCEVPNRPTQQVPQNSSEEISNQDAIIKSTVKLVCLVDAQRASQGSGTIINPNGTILTNKHVIAGTLGCRVGFINDFDDEPYFGAKHIADFVKISPNQDIAVLKIRNPQNKILPSVNIAKSGSNLRLGTKITTYGFPAKFGTKVTYTSGDFSGTDGGYLKTTAILEYGNSGGGAYLKDGTFIGVPSAVVKGELNALGYILSINTINAWLGNSSVVLGGAPNNQYSRVSALEDIKPENLGSLKLFIPQTDASGNLSASATNQQKQKATQEVQPSQTQEESTVIEPSDTKQNQSEIQKEPPKKISWPERLFFWLANLFSKLAK